MAVAIGEGTSFYGERVRNIFSGSLPTLSALWPKNFLLVASFLLAKILCFVCVIHRLWLSRHPGKSCWSSRSRVKRLESIEKPKYVPN